MMFNDKIRAFSPSEIPETGKSYPLLKNMKSPLVLEIGCGTGDFAIEYAQTNPDKSVIAIEKTSEKFRKFKDKLLEKNQQLVNLLPVHENAVNFVTHHIESKSISECFINYPNPYPKESQANKRFHRMPFFGFLISRMMSGGVIEFATNIEEMIVEIDVYCGEHWELDQVNSQILLDPAKAKTAFEKKYLSRGEKCFRNSYKLTKN